MVKEGSGAQQQAGARGWMSHVQAKWQIVQAKWTSHVQAKWQIVQAKWMSHLQAK